MSTRRRAPRWCPRCRQHRGQADQPAARPARIGWCRHPTAPAPVPTALANSSLVAGLTSTSAAGRRALLVHHHWQPPGRQPAATPQSRLQTSPSKALPPGSRCDPPLASAVPARSDCFADHTLSTQAAPTGFSDLTTTGYPYGPSPPSGAARKLCDCAGGAALAANANATGPRRPSASRPTGRCFGRLGAGRGGVGDAGGLPMIGRLCAYGARTPVRVKREGSGRYEIEA